MKRFALSFAALCALSACETAPVAGAGMPLTTQAEVSVIVGRTLTFNAGQSFVLNPDGTLTGTWDGAPLVGTYEMRDGYFCRTLTEFVSGPSDEDCQTFVLEGDTLRVARNRGAGAEFAYTVS